VRIHCKEHAQASAAIVLDPVACLGATAGAKGNSMNRIGTVVLLLMVGICAFGSLSAVLAQGEDGGAVSEANVFDPNTIVPASQYVVRTFEYEGQLIDEIIVDGKPPVGYRAPAALEPEPNVAAGVNILTDVPAFDWSYGCSATSAAMMMGYYDRHGYPNMYTGPTNGGVCPLNNSVWGHTSYPGVTCGECPLSATKQGIDGRASYGHVNDYWIDYGNAGPDPYVAGAWTEHTRGECTTDFMGTNQAKYGNTDGSTTFYNYTSGAILCDYTAPSGKMDGCHGIRAFAESRGYTVASNCSQYIYGYNGNTIGFTYAQYCAEIDAGRPVLIQVAGHTMLGYGYDSSTSLVYLRNTWDYNSHTMTWAGSYSGMTHYGVTTFQLAAAAAAITTNTTAVSVPEGSTATFQVKLTAPPSSSVTVSVARFSGDSDIGVSSGASLTFDGANWNTYQTVILAGAQDTDAIDGTTVVRCTASGMTPHDVTATEADDDRVILTQPSSIIISEAGSGVFNVKLKGQPVTNVTVAVARYTGDSDISVSAGASLFFTTSNWNTYQPVTVAAAHDTDNVDDSAVIRCTLTSWTSAEVSVTASDDEMTTSQVKQMADGSSVGCGAVVTAVFGDTFYLEAPDRSAGIRVNAPGHLLTAGMKGFVSGTVQTGSNGERVIEASATAQIGSGTVEPVGMPARNVGGGSWSYNPSTGAGQRGVAGGFGASNIGLLVRTCGKVVARHSAGDYEIASWTFDADPGWTTQGLWAWGKPTGAGSGYHDPANGYTGTNVMGYNLTGDYPSSMGSTLYATTPAIDCSEYSSVRLKFYRWMGVESSNYDHANVQVSADGANWTDVWVHSGSTFFENAWSYLDYDLSAVADFQSTVYVRWGMGPTDSSVTYCGWNLDDVQVTGSADAYFTIETGSGVNLKVLVPDGVTVPEVGSFVSVNGISSCEKAGQDLRSVLKMRSAEDLN